MKKALQYILTMVMALGISGCGDSYDPNGDLEPSLTAHLLIPSQDRFEDNLYAFTRTFSVETLDTPWKFSNSSTWFTLSPMSGKTSATISLTVEENTDANSARTSIFYLQSDTPDWTYSRVMTVSQGAALPVLELDETTLTFGGAASQKTINVESNCSWKASCTDSWVTLIADERTGKLNVYVTSNPTMTYRSSTITISYKDYNYKTISVTQSPANATVSADTLVFEKNASKYDIVIDSETDWTTNISSSWISMTPESGKAGKTTVSIEVTPNTSITARTGFVTIYSAESELVEIAITQKGFYIESDETVTLPSIVGSREISIRSNTSWTVTSKPSWLTVSPESGSENGVIVITTTDNPSTMARGGEIVLSQEGLSIECRINVVQLGKTVTPGVKVLELSDKAGQTTFNIMADTPWTAALIGDWFTATPMSGSGDATITVSAEENCSDEERSGMITYSYLDRTTSVNVVQMAKYITIDNQSFVFESTGGSHRIELSTNDEWTAEIEHNVSWLKLSRTAGKDSGVIVITAEDNPSVNTRSTAVVINTRYSQSIRILVSQKPRYLTVSTQNVLFFAKGGTSEEIMVNTDGQYDINTNVSWLTIKRGTGNTFTVSATENSAKTMRTGKIGITLTDVTDGSISIDLNVSQVGNGSCFVTDGYTQDCDWDKVGGNTLNLTIKGYTTDKNWDESSSGLSVNITGYSADQDWNNVSGSRGGSKKAQDR